MDYKWWSVLDDPMVDMVDAVKKNMKNDRQVINVYWVDFTIRWKIFDYLWKNE